MKNILSITLSILLTFSFAIAQDGINYQGAATDGNGDELTNQNITIRASVLSGGANGNLEWEETHSATTDQFGLFNVVIGQGTNTTNGATANFDDMDWGSGNHFLKIEMDATGGTNYAIIGTTQMMSVPYALYAKSAGTSSVTTSVSTFGDTLFINGQSIIIPGISFPNVVPTYGSVTDIDANTYQTVSYANKEWMTENLNTTHYNDGTLIPPNCQCNTNNYTCTPRWCYYNEDIQYSVGYGKLYVGYTMNSNNVCPVGWHVSTVEDWAIIAELFAINGEGWDYDVSSNTYSGTTGDVTHLLEDGSNQSYLSLGLYGYNNWDGNGNGMGSASRWLIPSQYPTSSHDFVNLLYNTTNGYYNLQPSGGSVYEFGYIRCVKD